jgi:hypothetical protein
MAHMFGYNVPIGGCITRQLSVVAEETLDKRDPIGRLQCSGDHLRPCLIYSCADKLDNGEL